MLGMKGVSTSFGLSGMRDLVNNEMKCLKLLDVRQRVTAWSADSVFVCEVLANWEMVPCSHS